jgi:acetoin utilization protein AcuB
MRVAEIMTKDVQTVPPTMPASEAWELMRRRRVRHLVVASGAAIVGVLSERDARVPDGAGARVPSRVQDLMTGDVVTTTPDATIRRVANVMQGRTIGCLPVVDGKRLVGIVTTSDLLRLLGGGTDRPARPSRRAALHYRVPHKKRSDGGSGRW